jgi:16S rRNA G966 N2-methylase RsmD
VTSVEKDPQNIRFIHQIIDKLDIDNLTVIKKDAFKFISTANEQFDIIFADPPYQLQGIEKLPGLIAENNLLKEGGYFILEHSKETDIPHNKNFIEHRRYGHVNFSFFTANSQSIQ